MEKSCNIYNNIEKDFFESSKADDLGVSGKDVAEQGRRYLGWPGWDVIRV